MTRLKPLLSSLIAGLIFSNGAAWASDTDERSEDKIAQELQYCSANQLPKTGLNWNMSEDFPERIQGHSAVYDVEREEVLLFGGRELVGYPPSLLSDTWTFDGYRWTHRGDEGPGARVKHSLANDRASGRVILFGGWNDQEGLLGDTWAWNGETWSQLAFDSPSPSPRFLHSMTFDEANDRVILVGGRDRSGSLEDVWVLADDEWERLKSGPGPREGHQLAYDSSRDRVLLFGGRDESGVLDQLWELAADEWSEVEVSGSRPKAREHHAMAYDARRSRLVVFGGRERWNGDRFGDSWEFDGQRWRKVADDWSGPNPRSSPSLTYVQTTGEAILVSGRAQNETSLALPYPFVRGGSRGDVWSWSGQSWTQRMGIVLRPDRREKATLAFDQARGLFLLHGGVTYEPEGEYGQMRDTWGWNGEVWRALGHEGPLGEPLAMGYDDQRQEVVLQASDESWWAWKGKYWERIEDEEPSVVRSTQESDRDYGAFASDSSGDRRLSFGGRVNLSRAGPTNAVTDESLSYEHEQWTELPRVSGAPTPQVDHLMVYDASRYQTVLYGSAGEESPGETWVRERGRWTKLDDTEGPRAADDGATMAYDLHQEKIILFADGETRAWNGERWLAFEELEDNPPKGDYRLAYDGNREKPVLFGMADDTDESEASPQFWAFDGESWHEIEFEEGPSPRREHAMVWDSTREVVLLVGGKTDDETLGDTWSWDGEEWELLAADEEGPGELRGHQLVDVSSTGLVLTKGTRWHQPGMPGDPTVQSELWAWDGESWEQIETLQGKESDSAPSARRGAALSYDSLCESVLFYGGQRPMEGGREPGVTRYEEWRTWELFLAP